MMLQCLSFLLFAVPAIAAAAEEPRPGNIAPRARPSASSSRPEFPPPGVNDHRMDTQWSTALGQTSGQWLRLDWDEPREIRAVVLHATGPWTQGIEVQADRDGSWVSVGRSGSREERAPLHAMVTFPPVRTRALLLVFDGGAAYHEVEVYEDTPSFARAVAEYTEVSIVLAGDLRGRLLGTVSQDGGGVAVIEADVTVTGTTPNGPWKETARTGRNGDFEVPLPFAAAGPIAVAMVKGDLAERKVFESRDISTCLTPRTEEGEKDRLSLDGTWEFAADPPSEFPRGQEGLRWSPIHVPAHWEMEGRVAESGRGAYRRTFDAPAGWSGRRIKLRAEAIYSHAQVWVNGRRAGGHEGGFTPFELDVTEMVKPGSPNEVLVLADARSPAGDLDNASYFAYFELAGIWGPIELFAADPVHISHLAVSTDFDAGYRDAELSVELDVVNEQAAASAAEVRLRLFDPRGEEVPLPGMASRVALSPWEKKTVNFKSAVKSPLWWNAEEPRLYRLEADLESPEAGKSTVVERVGFREIEIRGRTVTIDGRPVKFHGISRLDAHPLLGRALTPEVDRRDMEMIKGANFNMVRATIAPPHPASLDAADELGLYVESEGPTCWGGHAGDLRYAPVYQGVMSEVLERDRNHPSVVDWSLCNESSYERVFSMTHRKMKALDPTRLYSGTYGDATLDLTVYHHPITMGRIRDALRGPRPAFFDEVIGLFHGWEDLALFMDIDPGMRDYWITGLPEIRRALRSGENLLGAVQFSWVDDAFLVPGKGIDIWRRDHVPIRYTESVYKMPRRGLVGDDAWGTVDGWRRPRPEYWLSKKLYSPLAIEEKPLAIPGPGQAISIPVENLNQFADLDVYSSRWEIAGSEGEARLRAAPGTQGMLSIPVPRPPRPEEILTLRFLDGRGGLVDAYRLSFRPHEPPAFPGSGRPARIAEETGYLVNASAVRLLGPDVELAYDRTNGELYRALAGREVVMTLGPHLHLQKSKAPMLRYPTGSPGKIGVAYGPEDVPGDSVWRLTGSESRTEGGQAVLQWLGRYGKDFEGGFEVRMDDAGDVECRYRFTFRGPEMLVREIGLEFELPLACDRLRWDRRAEYSYYPDDHIGRPVGEAVAHPAAAQTVPPGDRPYGLDDHPWGSNDFRSTKRNIYTASLTDGEGQGVQVVSDGTQHVRASVATHEIQLEVLDFYGGMSWTYNNGYHYGPGRTIKPGEVLEGTVRLRMLAGR